jgi:hypothetical protein
MIMIQGLGIEAYDQGKVTYNLGLEWHTAG